MRHPELGRIRTEPRIVHRLENWPNQFFSRGPWIRYGLIHNYSAEIELDQFCFDAEYDEGRGRTARRDPSEMEKQAIWAPLRSLGDVAPPSRRVFTEGRLLIAQIQIEEIPHRWVAEVNESWAVAFEDYEDKYEYEVVDRLRAVDDGRTLRNPLQVGGSLLMLYGLEVHPAFTGQRLGARLLMHALWELIRHPDDLLYLRARPLRQFFTRERTAGTASTRR